VSEGEDSVGLIGLTGLGQFEAGQCGDLVAWYINAFYDNNHIHIHISRPYSLYLSATKTGPGSNPLQSIERCR
jgi:hypothetical protein